MRNCFITLVLFSSTACASLYEVHQEFEPPTDRGPRKGIPFFVMAGAWPAKRSVTRRSTRSSFNCRRLKRRPPSC